MKRAILRLLGMKLGKYVTIASGAMFDYFFAELIGKPVEEVYKYFHEGFIDLYQKLGITYDLYTTTHSENHFKVSRSIFLALQKNGFLFTKVEPQWFSPGLNRFLPDRYVEGTDRVRVRVKPVVR